MKEMVLILVKEMIMTKLEKIISIITAWEEVEFGHYECDCVPANKEQIKKLAKSIVKSYGD